MTIILDEFCPRTIPTQSANIIIKTPPPLKGNPCHSKVESDDDSRDIDGDIMEMRFVDRKHVKDHSMA